MFYVRTITVPANTSKSSPYRETLLAVKGVIHRVIIIIPAGHFGLTGLRILHENTPIAPNNPDGWFKGDNVKIDYNEFYELRSFPALLEFEAYNEDDTYDHEFIIGIGILPKSALMPFMAYKGLIHAIKSLIWK